MVRIEDIERETTHREKEQEGARKQRREQEEGESRMEERRGKRKRDGQVEMERQEARIRAERLDTSQHSNKETQLTRIRDINERTATRAGDLGHVEGGIHVATGENTEGHLGVGPGGGRLWRNGSGAGLGPLQEGEPEDALGEGGCLGGRELWAMLGEGVEKPEGRGCPREREAQKGLTSSILIHHAQPLCLVLSLEGIEIQDTEGKKGKTVKMR